MAAEMCCWITVRALIRREFDDEVEARKAIWSASPLLCHSQRCVLRVVRTRGAEAYGQLPALRVRRVARMFLSGGCSKWLRLLGCERDERDAHRARSPHVPRPAPAPAAVRTQMPRSPHRRSAVHARRSTRRFRAPTPLYLALRTQRRVRLPKERGSNGANDLAQRASGEPAALLCTRKLSYPPGRVCAIE